MTIVWIFLKGLDNIGFTLIGLITWYDGLIVVNKLVDSCGIFIFVKLIVLDVKLIVLDVKFTDL